jgi:hypothetical protein
MKKIFGLLFLFVSLNSFAQIGLQLLQFRPTGEMGMVMKKGITGELLYMDNFDDRWRVRAGLSFISLRPRMDTFPSYAIEESNGVTVLGGYQVFHKYSLTFLSVGVDYSIIDKEPFFFYPGVDLVVGGLDTKYDTSYPTFLDESYSGGEVLVGFRFRLGGEYAISKTFGVFAEITRSFYFINETGFFSNNNIGIGLHVTLNN